MISIEKGIAIPEKKRAHGNSKYPFRSMEIGDSFSVPHSSAARNAICVSCSHAKRRHNLSFAIRRVTDEQGCEIIRVWRVA